jgi:hypothetical protein
MIDSKRDRERLEAQTASEAAPPSPSAAPVESVAASKFEGQNAWNNRCDAARRVRSSPGTFRPKATAPQASASVATKTKAAK